MTRWAAIQYRDFWDQPLIFLLNDGGRTFLFDCPFDDSTEDYLDAYQVHLMPNLNECDLSGSWAELYQKSLTELGTVPVADVKFDPTKRLFADASILDRLTASVIAKQSVCNVQ